MTTLPFSANAYKIMARKAAHNAAALFRIYGNEAQREEYLAEARTALNMAVEAGLECSDVEAQVQAWFAEA